jgi:AcrR family transcriptional regulator
VTAGAPTDLEVEAEAAPRPGRHRSEACDTAILDATLDELASAGYVGLTVSAVIARAHVSSATLYRRWATKLDLVTAAIQTLVLPPEDIDTGALVTDLEQLVDRMAASMQHRREDVADAIALETQRNPELAAMIQERFVRPRLRHLESLLARAKARGEIDRAPAAEVVLSLVVGPLHHRVFTLGKDLTPSFRKMVARAAHGALVA